jgi:hypothetical protein
MDIVAIISDALQLAMLSIMENGLEDMVFFPLDIPGV